MTYFLKQYGKLPWEIKAALRDGSREVTVPAQEPGWFDAGYARIANDLPIYESDEDAEVRSVWDERTLEILKLKDKQWVRDAPDGEPSKIKNYLNQGKKSEVEKASEILKAKVFLDNLERMVAQGRGPLAEIPPNPVLSAKILEWRKEGKI